MRVFEYVDRRGDGAFTRWYQQRQTRQRAALDSKLDTVRAAGEAPAGGRGDLPPNLLRGPVHIGNKTYPNTYKLTVNCNGAIRLLSCRGPFDPANEVTILVPTFEVGGRYPPGSFEEAERRRVEILADPSRRRELVRDDD